MSQTNGEDVAARIQELVGIQNFVRHNPQSDHFTVHRFHHIEFWCADATNAYKRFQVGLGMQLAAKSDQSTNNGLFASYAVRSGELLFSFTAPYSKRAALDEAQTTHPLFDSEEAFRFVKAHGLGARAIGVTVDDAATAFRISVERGAVAVTSPVELPDPASETTQCIAEVQIYGDVVLRFISGSFAGPYLAGYETVDGPGLNYGLTRLDHAVGNVHNLLEAANYIMGFTGFHRFAEFTAKDVGTVDSGLNSFAMANNNEYVLLLVNEPTFGTKRKSQIQTYLEQNEGPGVQHLAIKTNDIFKTLKKMRAVSEFGGFEFMPRPDDGYYKRLPDRIGDALTPEQYEEMEKLGVLADRDDQGLLLQIFTKPVSDRATIFLEIIQRIGCEHEEEDENGTCVIEQSGGCGGFGKGNITELFRCVEEYEKSLAV